MDLDPARLPARVLDLLRGGRAGEALALAERAVAAHPGAAGSWLSLARARLAGGDAKGARAAAATSAAHESTAGEGTLLEAMLAASAGEAGVAADRFARVCAAVPGAGAAWLGLGEARLALGEAAAAHAAFARAAALLPAQARAHRGLAGAALAAGDPAAAVQAAQQALALDGVDVESRFVLALARIRLGDTAGALAALDALLARTPGHLPARWLRGAVAPTTVFPDADGEARSVADYRATLQALAAVPIDAAAARALKPALTSQLRFDLPYLVEDARPLAALHGALLARCAALADGVPELPPRPARTRTRVVVATSLAHGHSVMKLFERVLLALDRGALEVLLLHTGPHRDAVTERLTAGLDGFAQVTDPDQARGWILAQAPDVLLWTDLGMDPAMLWLGAQRLAPRQYALWGHPVTTGLPTIDAFLAPGAMERDDAQDDYVEPLLRLPGLGCDFDWPAPLPPPAPRADGSVVLRVAQSLPKLTARHDALFARILAATPGARLALSPGTDAAVLEALRARMRRALDAAGVRDPAALSITPFRSQAEWTRELAATDLNLDTTGFSGGITSFELLGHGIPTVAWPGRTLRGRQTLALLRLLELEELVARDADDYVRIAVDLARSADRRAAIREALLARRERLRDGGATARALSAILRGA
jgi:tetratricopeptide (TPR) repeat protein